jgi:site-specific DNA-methyltransferase (adenine-specific)
MSLSGKNPFAAKTMPMKRHENILVFYRKTPTYNPQMEKGKPYIWDSKRSGGEAGGIVGKNDKINNEGTRYPNSILRMKQERGLHPTQKPVELIRYLIRTYSNKHDIVMDCTMGSGTTGVAAVMENRHFIGMESDIIYFELATRRIRGEECRRTSH